MAKMICPVHQARHAAHAAFDTLWKGNGPMRKAQAYKWLKDVMGLQPAKAHIGVMDITQCNRVIELVEAKREEMKQKFRTLPASTQIKYMIAHMRK